MANRPTQLGDNWFAFPFHLLATASPPLGQECERTLTNEVVAGRTSRDERGWRATFYTTGLEHSPTSATGTRGSGRRGARRERLAIRRRRCLRNGSLWYHSLPPFSWGFILLIRGLRRGRGVTRTSVDNRRRRARPAPRGSARRGTRHSGRHGKHWQRRTRTASTRADQPIRSRRAKLLKPVLSPRKFTRQRPALRQALGLGAKTLTVRCQGVGLVARMFTFRKAG
jgi:hypothetical protein